MRFSWDIEKEKTNLSKHKVSFREASTVFADTFSITFDDPKHSIGEHRMLTFGLSAEGRMFAVSHVERGSFTRIISARPLTKRERRIYED